MALNAYTQRLRRLFYVFLALIFIAYSWIAFESWQNTLDDTKQTLNYINSAQIQGLHSTLKSHELVLISLGVQLVKLGALQKPENGRALLEQIKSLDKDMIGFGLSRPDGQLVLVSGIKPGSKLPNLLDNEESHDSFLAALKSDHIQMGRVYFMRALQQWAIPIRAPIHDKKGKVIAVMTAGYDISASNTGWANMTLPHNIATALLREDGYLQYFYPRPAAFSIEETYLKPAHPLTLQQIRALPEKEGFSLFFFSRMNASFYVFFSHIPEYELLSAAFIPKYFVVLNWLYKLIASSILLLLSLLAGYWIYRRTERQEASSQQEISKLTNWQRAVLDSADYSIISTETNGIILSFNLAAERMLGYSADEMIGKQSPAIIHDLNEIMQRAGELSKELGKPIEPGFEVFIAKAKTEKLEEREWTYVRKDGTRFPVRLTVTPVYGSENKISGYLGVAEDLTEKKYMQEQFKESEARYKNLFDGASDSIFLMHGEYFTECNPATLEMFGCTREQIIGQPPYRFSPEFQPDGRLSKGKALEKITSAFNGESPTFEWQHCRYDGIPFDAEVSLNAIQISGESYLLATVRDISARKASEQMLEHMVNHDSLTGLRNRYAMHNEIKFFIDNNTEQGAALLLIDLDRFKEINDTLGHHIGDQILEMMGKLLLANFPDNAYIYRLGGDEFTIFFPELTSNANIEKLARNLRNSIRQPFEIDGINLEVDSSIGIAIYPQHGNDSHELLRSADVAMYTAKAAGGGVAIYNPATDQHSHERLAIIGELGTAIREDQLRLFYQPKFDLHTQRVTGFEALLRWQHPKLGLIYPDSFIPLAEVSDIIHPLTLEVINLAFRQQGAWMKAGLNFSVAVNISSRNLTDDNCINHLQHALQNSAINPEQLELEITESSLMKDPEGAALKLNKIAALGVKISIDDFGTGFSSLAYLKKLPISTLKIDRAFVKDMLNSEKDKQIVQSTISLAHSLNIRVVAEGVEDRATFEALQDAGCDMAQGYYLSKPLPWPEISQWMQTSTLLIK